MGNRIEPRTDTTVDVTLVCSSCAVEHAFVGIVSTPPTYFAPPPPEEGGSAGPREPVAVEMETVIDVARANAAPEGWTSRGADDRCPACSSAKPSDGPYR